MRLSIQKKIVLLTTLLLVMLIASSILGSAVIFMNKVKSDAMTLCETSSQAMATMIEQEYETFVPKYRTKLDVIYQENKESIEHYSLDKTISYDEKQEFFTNLTSSLFPPAGALGLSYEMAEFKNTYTGVLQYLDLVATTERMVGGFILYYDESSDNLVYMCDSTPSASLKYNFPGSIEKASTFFKANVINLKTPIAFFEDDAYQGFAPIKDSDGNIQAYVGFYYSIDNIVTSQKSYIWTLVIFMTFSSILILFIFLFFANRIIVKNVKLLSSSAQEFTSKLEHGDKLEVIKPDIKSKDEIGALSDNFYQLQVKMVEYISDLEQKTLAEAQMKSDLSIASKIQLESLPSESLVFKNVLISSFIKPAKEVGGDLFDYFVLDKNKCFFVIADVSGKGVSAALFMMKGKEIIRSSAKRGLSPSEIAKVVNEELCINNHAGLFITAFMGIYDTSTNLLSFVRCGHEQPFLLHDKHATQIGDESNIVLGLFDDFDFIEDQIYLSDGDKLLLYTDGVNEGINNSNEEYGYDRIQNILENEKDDVLNALYSDLTEFAGEAEQFDDITMLLIDVVKTYNKEIYNPQFKDIPIVTDEIDNFVSDFTGDKVSELNIIIDELMNNYISYAFDNVQSPYLKILATIVDSKLTITFEDNGMLFNPLLSEGVNLEDDALTRPSGGMGITFVKALSDDIKYKIVNNKNQLTILKKMT